MEFSFMFSAAPSANGIYFIQYIVHIGHIAVAAREKQKKEAHTRTHSHTHDY